MSMLHFKIIAQVLFSKCLYCIRVLIAKLDQIKRLYAKSAPPQAVKPFQAKNNRNQNNDLVTPVMKTKQHP